MNTPRTFVAAAIAISMLAMTGCAVSRGQESVGAYADDAAITTLIKTRYVNNLSVDAASIKVETQNGTVLLSGFAKNSMGKSTAETIAWRVGGVKSVRNEIAVRP